MGNDLLQMPTPSGTSSGLMDFSSALSPTSFGGMDLLDWDDGTAGQGTPGASGTSGGDSADLMTFVETFISSRPSPSFAGVFGSVGKL
ncbi:hypothetical protein PF002_g11803 [Phytophthora fragariae]|uniref:Uncharacterized protein n=1 Tax=Phytophthora fragariae TaxID=53985 RepID=A0A6A3ZF87_9STRA|nr:hypothetical protein PF002_g11803 [Phytophthora fragariae]